MKTKLYLLAILFLCSMTTFGQSPSWVWSKSSGGTYYDEGNSIATDAKGNVLVTGYFRSPSITFGSTTLINANNTGSKVDMFIVKYVGSGDVLWAKNARGTSGSLGNSVTTDASGNILVTGIFGSPSISFGSTTLTSTNNGSSDMFIVKYDQSGDVLWAKSAGGTSTDRGNSIATDASGNVLVTGYFYSPSITFGSTTLTNADDTGNNADMFIVKYDGSGNILWAKSPGGTYGAVGVSVATDASGNVLVTGCFYSPSITFGSTTLTNAGIYDMFIVKYDGSGNVLWAKNAGGTFNDVGRSVATDASGNVLVTGDFSSPSITFGLTTLTNKDTICNADMFIVKYDASGNVLWAKRAGGTSSDDGTSVATDASGNVLVTGYFRSPSITFGPITLNNAGNADMFIVKYAGSGNLLWVKSTGETSYDIGSGVATDASGNVLVTGCFYSPSISFGTTNLTNAGKGNMFIAKLNSSTGIEETSPDKQFNLYPNPAIKSFNISCNFPSPENLQITIINNIGQIISSKEYRRDAKCCVSTGRFSKEIPLDNIPAGVYFIQVKSEGNVYNQKLVKME